MLRFLSSSAFGFSHDVNVFPGSVHDSVKFWVLNGSKVYFEPLFYASVSRSGCAGRSSASPQFLPRGVLGAAFSLSVRLAVARLPLPLPGGPAPQFPGRRWKLFVLSQAHEWRVVPTFSMLK